MTDTMTLQIAQRGLITLPKSLRLTYGLQQGDLLTLLDLGGVFVLSPHRSETDFLAEQVRTELEHSGESLEDMLLALRERRERYTAKDNE